MPLDNHQIKELNKLGFRFRNRKRYTLLTEFGQFFSLNIYEEGCFFEIDGKLIKSKPLSFEKVVRVIKTLYPNE